jgi:hypothetical protein
MGRVTVRVASGSRRSGRSRGFQWSSPTRRLNQGSANRSCGPTGATARSSAITCSRSRFLPGKDFWNSGQLRVALGHWHGPGTLVVARTRIFADSFCQSLRGPTSTPVNNWAEASPNDSALGPSVGLLRSAVAVWVSGVVLLRATLYSTASRERGEMIATILLPLRDEQADRCSAPRRSC